MLDEILARLGSLTVEARQEVVTTVLEATRDMKWWPNVGPQTEAYFTLADETFYGGSAGGGKSALINGVAINEHKRTLILRQFREDAKKLAEAELIGMILGGNKDGWNGSDLIYRGEGQSIQYGGCDHEDDKQRYKGDPHDLICVGYGTPILMADGSYKPVNDLKSGDMLQTLEGPKPLEKIYPRQNKECVEIIAYDNNGNEIARQVQSSTHDVLTNLGWFSSVSLGEICAPKKFRGIGRFLQWSLERCELVSRRQQSNIDRFQRMGELVQMFLCHLFCLVGRAFCLKSFRRDCVVVSCGRSQEWRQLLLSFFQITRLQCQNQSISSCLGRSFSLRGASGVRKSSKLQDCLASYLFCIRQCGARIRKSAGSLIGLRGGQECLLQLVDVVLSSPSRSQDDGAADTQKYSRSQCTYLHPYTKEKRLIDGSCSLRASAFKTSNVGVMDVYDIQVKEVNHYISKGGFVNKNCWDEVTDFSYSQYRFVNIWNRSAVAGQRCRIIATGNPPTTAAGLWVVHHWGAWLDPEHPNPAKPGELRWYVVGPNDEDIEVDGIGPHYFDWSGKDIYARSRTFIPAKLSDNPDLMDGGHYESMLDSLPKELREAYRDGLFKVVLNDQPNQLMPAAWVKAAQERWTDQPPEGVPMCAMGVDVAQGGNDNNIIAPRYDAWYAPLIKIPGRDTPLGTDLLGPIMAARRNNAKIILDVGGGYGSDTYKSLVDNSIPVTPHKGAAGSYKKSECGLFHFYNYRTEVYYRFMEALNPAQPGGSRIALPPDTTLFADLTCILFTTIKSTSGLTIKLESKEALVKRIGRSPDHGDAVVNAWSDGDKIENSYQMWQSNKVNKKLGRRPVVKMNTRGRSK